MKSELCIYDRDRDAVRVLMTHNGHIEAPNWHPGGYLIVNGGGQLFRVPLDAPALVPIETGFAGKLNNDHGISPDGKTLMFCDKTLTEASCIYTLPIGGGTPVRVTPKVPSWWHSWSPDGARIAYVGARGDRVLRLYSSAVDGSDERLVMGGFDHIDGPDYTPDGEWIWFNGEKDGAVDLWRVRTDGTDLERMTDGPTVDWFPHPSPDGAVVLFLEYPVGTTGHPGGVDVALCVMPAQGGPRRVVTRLFGGQGTMNVPCWAPDGRQFAFMRYVSE